MADHEEELRAENDSLLAELGQVKAELLISQKQVNDARVTVEGYLGELQRIGTETQKLLAGVATIQLAGDRLRTRLAKVQKALAASEKYAVVANRLATQQGLTLFEESELTTVREDYARACAPLMEEDLEPPAPMPTTGG